MLEQYHEGFNSYLKGQKLCPYSKLSEKWKSWMRGYYTAEYGNKLNTKLV